MNITIRNVNPNDAKDIYLIRQDKEVMKNLLSFPYESYDKIENQLKNIGNNEYRIVAEINKETKNKVIGYAVLVIQNNTRKRHCATLGIMVDSEYQGKGVGKTLMTELINLADNFLMLKRIELTVFTKNIIAINLYKRFDFVIEGVKKYASITNGLYCDEYMMARYKK